MDNGYYDSAVAAGLDPSLAAYMPRYVQIESGGDPNAQTGSYRGLLQMGSDETKRYGGNGFAMYADRAKTFQNKYGRAPSPTELYLANQQGEGGLAAHLQSPDAPAWQNMYSTAEGQKKGAGWAKQAIWGNVPDDLKEQFPGGVDSLTSKQFMDLWQHKVEQTPFNSAFANTRKSNMDPMQQALATQQPDNQYAYAPGYAGVANKPGISGLFDRLRAGGPGALFGAPNGVFPGANGQPGYDLGSALQTAGAFGMGQPGAAVALQAPHRKFVQIGTDEMGNPRYGWVDEHNGTVTPADNAGASFGGGASNGAGGSVASSSFGDLANRIKAAKANGASREDLIKMVPAGLQPDLGAMVNYQAVPYNLTRQGPLRNTLLNLGHTIDDSFDETKLPARVDFQKKLAGQSLSTMGGQRQALGTALEHLGVVGDKAVDTGNTNGAITGLDIEARAENALKNSTVDNAAKVSAFDNAVDKYTGEVSKLYYGTAGGGVQERAATRGRFTGNSSAASQAAGLETELGLLTGKYQQMQAQIDEQLPGSGIKVIGPAQQAAINNIQKQIATLRSRGTPTSKGTLPAGVTSIKVIE